MSEPKFRDVEVPKFRDVSPEESDGADDVTPKFRDVVSDLDTGTPLAVQPAPSVVSEPVSSIGEDARRVGKWFSALPEKIVGAGIHGVEAVTDIPLSQIYQREMYEQLAKHRVLPPSLPAPVDAAIRGKSTAELVKERGAQQLPQSEAEAALPRNELPYIGATPREMLNLTTQGMVSRPIKFLQRTFGKPLAEGVLAATKPGNHVPEETRQVIPGGGTEGGSQQPSHPEHLEIPSTLGPEADEMLSREVLSMLGGPSIRMDDADPRKLTAVNQLDSKYGTRGAAFVHSFAREIGGLPLYLINTGSGGYATKALRGEIEAAAALAPAAMKEALPGAVNAARAESLASGFIEGTTQGAGQAAASGQDPLEGAKMGGAVGGVFGVLGSAFAKRAVTNQLSTGLHEGAIVPTSSYKELVNQLDASINTAKASVKKVPAGTVDKLRARSVDRAPIESTTPIVDPTMSYMAIDHTGQLVRRDVAVDIKTGAKNSSYPEYSVHDTPINESNVLKAPNKLNFKLATPEAQAAYDSLYKAEQIKHGEHTAAGTAAYMAPEVMAEFPQGYAVMRKHIADSRPQTPSSLNATRSEKPVSAGEVADTVISGTVLTVRKDGRVIASTIARPKPRAPYEAVRRGDTVSIDGEATGTVTSTPRGGSDATVELSNGKRVQVPRTSLSIQEPTRIQYQRKLDAMRQPQASADPGVLGPREKAIITGHDRIMIGDLPRMLNRPPEQIPALANAIREMEASGSLKEIMPGVFEPTHDYASSIESKPGRFVYFKTTESGAGRQGVYRGVDPRNRNNVLIEEQVGDAEVMSPIGPVAEKTKFISIPKTEARNIWPVHLAQKSLADAEKLSIYGITKPMPPGYVTMSDRTNQDMIELSKMWQRTAQQPGWVQKAIQGGKDAFLGSMHQTPPLLRQGGSQMLHGLRDVAKSEGAQRAQTLAKGLGGYLSPASQELEKVLAASRGRNNGAATEINAKQLQEWTAKYPKEAASIIGQVKQMVAESGELSKYLASRGIGNIDELEVARAAGKEPEYLTGMFNAFMMPREEWAKYLTKNLSATHENAIKYMYSQRPDLKPNQIGQKLDEILRTDNPILGLQQAGFLGADAKKKLIARVDIPAPIKALLGEHRGAALQLSYTVANQRQLAKSLQAWDAVAQSPYWSSGPRPDLTLRVPAHPMFGEAANGWTHESLRPLLDTNPSAKSSSMLGAIGWLGKKWKGAHTVYNITSWVNNAVRNLKGVALSGAFTGPEDLAGFNDAATMMLDYSRDPSTLGPNAPYIEAMDFDAVSPGFSGSELTQSQKAFQERVLRELSKANNGSAPIEDALASVRDIMSVVPEHAHAGYDAIDRWFKLGSYLNLRKRFLGQGLNKHDAAARASLVINDSYPNYARVPQWVKDGAKHWGLLAPFLTSKMEDIRINGTAVARIAKTLANPTDPGSDPALLMRLMALTAMAGGAIGLADSVRRSNGITDDVKTDALEKMPLRAQGYRPAMVPSLDYDDKGRLYFYDLTPYEDLLMTLRGNVHDEWYLRMLRNNAVDIVGDKSNIGQTIDSGLEQAGLRQPQKPMTPPRPDQTGVLSFLQQGASGFVPSTITNAQSAWSRTEERAMSPTDELWTPQQATERSLGLPMAGPVGKGSHLSRVLESNAGVNDALYQTKQGIKSGIRSGADKERMQYIINSNMNNVRGKIGDFPQQRGPRKLKRRDEK